jgi:hypothetical protein
MGIETLFNNYQNTIYGAYKLERRKPQSDSTDKKGSTGEPRMKLISTDNILPPGSTGQYILDRFDENKKRSMENFRAAVFQTAEYHILVGKLNAYMYGINESYVQKLFRIYWRS